ncbi:NAD(P)H-binding protein [Roseateles sp. LYH14W]|uniref:NAD(P)H-binding protein n=1 Tax=Pelomonas parva TaxID=3299032 RepID=A0ABW7F1X9_9BURK
MTDRHVLILGAAGRLGRELTTAFARAGWHARAQLRGEAPPEWRGLHLVSPLRADALDTAALGQAAAGCSVVVNALNAPYHRWDQAALPLARSAQAAARQAGALLMLPGNVYNFGRELPARLAPGTPEVGDTPKARLRIRMEGEMADDTGLDSLALRAGDFFGGAGRGSWFDLAIVSRLAAGKLVYPGDATLPHAWAYLPDLAATFVALAEQRGRLKGHQRLHFAGNGVSGEQLRQALSEASGRELKLAGMPWGLLKLAAPFVPSWRAVLEMRYLWLRAHSLDGAALAAQIGPEPHTPLVPALRQSLVALGLPVAHPTADRLTA